MDEQETWCGYSAPFLGQCQCGDALHHQPGGMFYRKGRQPDDSERNLRVWGYLPD